MMVPRAVVGHVLIFVSLLAHIAHADYTCSCNYANVRTVYSRTDNSSTVLGHLYEFDCKPSIPATDSKWQPLMFENNVGYVLTDSSLYNQICPGSIPSGDLATTSAPTSSTITMAPSTTTATTTSLANQQQSTTAQVTQKPQPSTANVHTTINTTPSLTPQPTTTQAAKPTTKQTAKTTSTQASKPTTTQASKPTTAQATKLTTTQAAKPTTTKTTKQPTTTYIPTTQRTTTTKPSTTVITPAPTTKLPVTQKITTPAPVKTTSHKAPIVTTPSAHTNYGCPPHVTSAAQYNHGQTRTDGRYCYELVPHHTASWAYAETNCQHKGGHLVHISNSAEESYIMKFLHDYLFTYAFWIGLNDKTYEESFQWSSGDPVTYTKWLANSKSQYHHYEDCVVLVPYLHSHFLGSYGEWDDIECTAHHPWICQYDAVPVQHPLFNFHTTTLAPVIQFFQDLFGK